MSMVHSQRPELAVLGPAERAGAERYRRVCPTCRRWIPDVFADCREPQCVAASIAEDALFREVA